MFFRHGLPRSVPVGCNKGAALTVLTQHLGLRYAIAWPLVMR